MTRREAPGSGNPNQAAGRHTGTALPFGIYPLGQARRVTRDNNWIEDRDTDPNIRR